MGEHQSTLDYINKDSRNKKGLIPPNNINDNSTSVNHIYLNLNNKRKDSKIKLTNIVEGYHEHHNPTKANSRRKKSGEISLFKKANHKFYNNGMPF